MRIVISLIMLSFILPRVAVYCVSAWWSERKIKLLTKAVLGCEMRRLTMRRVMVANKPLPDFDKWFHYLRGDLDLVGPKAIAAKSLSTLEKQHRARFKVAPGIFSPYRAKRAAGIAYLSEPETAVDFVKNDSKLRRLSLLIVCVLGRLVGVDDSKLSTLDHFSLFGVRINNMTMREAVNNIMSSLDKRQNKTDKTVSLPAQFAFVNADCANQFYTDDNYRRLLNKFSGVFADGVGVKIAARLSSLRMKENVNGTDMFPLLCEQLDKSTKRVFLLGAKPEVVKTVVQKLAREYPNIVVADYVDGFTYQNDQLGLRQRINRAKADIMFVAMGAPRQEQWIEANASTLNVSAMIGVGGLFDFYSETVSRAPVWMRELSLEWVWRLAMQPMDKAKRYLVGNPLFLFRVFINRNAQKQQELTLETS